MSRYGRLKDDEGTSDYDPWPIRAPVSVKPKPWWVLRAVKYAALFTLASMIGGTIGSVGFVNDCDAQEIPLVVPDTNAIVVLVQNYQPEPYRIFLWARGQYHALGTAYPGKGTLFVIPSRGLEQDSTIFLAWIQHGTHHIETSEPTVRRAGKIKLIKAQFGEPVPQQQANILGVIRCKEGYRPIKCALSE